MSCDTPKVAGPTPTANKIKKVFKPYTFPRFLVPKRSANIGAKNELYIPNIDP
jgi:hypothetical protein